jgi:hypothetical protein
MGEGNSALFLSESVGVLVPLRNWHKMNKIALDTSMEPTTSNQNQRTASGVGDLLGVSEVEL